MLHIKPTRLFIAVSALALSSPGVFASQPVHTLDPMIISAQRISQPLSQTLAAATVITREDIQRLQASSLAELLQGQAGVEMARNSGQLSTTSLFMRGGNSNHTLVLLNGQKINDATNGMASLQFIPLHQIERIEIVRGPQSSVWGADALGGVINIITHTHATQGISGNASQTIGRNQTWQADLNLNAVSENTQLSIQLGQAHSDGFNARTTDLSGDEDGYQQQQLSIHLVQQLGNQHQLSATSLYSEGELDYDGCSNDAWQSSHQCLQTFRLINHQLGWQAELSPEWTMQLNLSRQDEQRENFFEQEDNGQLHVRRDTASLLHLFQRSRYSATLGLEANREKLLEADQFTETSRRYVGGFVQGSWQITDPLRLHLGARHDDDEFFGRQTSRNTGLSLQTSDRTRISASYAEGYRAPHLGELYGPWGPNPDLKPEESETYELSLSYTSPQGIGAELTGFHTKINQLIISVCDANWICQNENIDKARIRGAELSIHYRSQTWNSTLSITRQDPENRDTGEQLARRSEVHGRFDLDYLADVWRIGASVVGQGSRPNSDFDEINLSGYGVLNLRAAWDFAPAWNLALKLDNAGDKNVVLADTYNSPGRYWEARLSYGF